MHVLYVIPARLVSTRLHHKPLRLLAGQPLVRRVVQHARELELDGPIVVASDSRRVLSAVSGLGVDAVLTHPGHASGTSRVGEVVQRPEYAGFDVIVNLQGDEPFMPRAAVHGAVARVRTGDHIGTAAAALGAEDWSDQNRVKVDVDGRGRAVAFCRSARPPVRPACPERSEGSALPPSFRRHIGIYAYRRDALRAWLEAPAVDEEKTERLEQLRPLALGMSIGVALIDEEAPSGIDTEQDLALADAWLRSNVPLAREGEGTGVRQ